MWKMSSLYQKEINIIVTEDQKLTENSIHEDLAKIILNFF